ncbi:hypothetical protein [Thermoanaerobacterium thermosaccharolyticum]|jgi:hypothetical protein|uniref:hypothetical protein n=1 Tax=Thermoanaerobacterium thermosaccharolyticum TaxID=1517 RepID=UPI00177AE0F5|nr:hypothetical protein [Thermoanaerobacterium thermosaccharolyticum]MBE0069842.1 hypothetical protein [Thermoanaerobacterium thermosaccharolyticum]MBE0227493.1 hypothetical protein [Thermoanaerobacterium thermosaccharolyticum]
MSKKWKNVIISFGIAILMAIGIINVPQYSLIYWIFKFIFFLTFINGVKLLIAKSQKEDSQN